MEGAFLLSHTHTRLCKIMPEISTYLMRKKKSFFKHFISTNVKVVNAGVFPLHNKKIKPHRARSCTCHIQKLPIDRHIWKI